MFNYSKGDSASQGVADQDDKRVPELSQIKKWLKDDVGRSVSLLLAIQNDEILQDRMADLLQGRLINHFNSQKVGEFKESFKG